MRTAIPMLGLAWVMAAGCAPVEEGGGDAGGTPQVSGPEAGSGGVGGGPGAMDALPRDGAPMPRDGMMPTQPPPPDGGCPAPIQPGTPQPSNWPMGCPVYPPPPLGDGGMCPPLPGPGQQVPMNYPVGCLPMTPPQPDGGCPPLPPPGQSLPPNYPVSCLPMTPPDGGIMLPPPPDGGCPPLPPPGQMIPSNYPVGCLPKPPGDGGLIMMPPPDGGCPMPLQPGTQAPPNWPMGCPVYPPPKMDAPVMQPPPKMDAPVMQPPPPQDAPVMQPPPPQDAPVMQPPQDAPVMQPPPPPPQDAPVMQPPPPPPPKMDAAPQDTTPPREQPELPSPAASPAPSATSLSYGSPANCSLPNLNKITITPSGNTVVVTGAAGAVPNGATVYVQSLPVGASVSLTANTDGSFSKTMPGNFASTIVVNCSNGPAQSWQQAGAALFLHAGQAASSKTSIPVAVGGPGDDITSEYWVASGNMNGWSFAAGETVTWDMNFTMHSPRLTTAVDTSKLTNNQQAAPRITLVRLADKDGNPIQANFTAVLLTPTGVPIYDRAEVSNDGWRTQSAVMGTVTKENGSLTINYRLTFKLPADMPRGTYAPAFEWSPLNALLGPSMQAPSMNTQNQLTYQQGVTSRNWGAVIKVGEPANARVPWVLLGNTFSNGGRGTVAREDRGKFEFNSKTIYNAGRFIIPKSNAQGQPIAYRLEPSLPTISHQIGGPNRPVPPLVSFVFPYGQLEVSVKKPDGTTETLGTAPFRSGRAHSTVESDFGPTSMNDVYELTTFDPAFTYQFAAYGHYEITMRGWARDAIGNVYEGGGTYDVYVAETLDIDLGTFPNTPFEVGDTMSPVVHVNPPVPATVTMTLDVYPNSSTSAVINKTLTGTANAFGYYHPGTSATQLSLTSPGEYKLDVIASYTDAQGVLWMGAHRAANVIETPNSPIKAHGRRGVTHQSGHFGSAWFTVRDILPNDEQGSGSPVFMPYHTGDVQWSADESDSGIFPSITMQDDMKVTTIAKGLPDSEVSSGEIDVALPAVMNRQAQAVQVPDQIKTWNYAYFSAMRPGVMIRSFVASGDVQRAYWQFNDRYNAQIGNGSSGDKVDDAKLHFGGVVYRDTQTNTNYYAIYASMATMVPRSSTLGQRIFPPFQGNGGGPSGGPLITVGGEPIDIFFTPVGVMPGQVLTQGQPFSMSGVAWPTLPAKLDVVVTKPDGTQVTTSGRANKIGAFYKPADDFAADQLGRYTAQVTILYDGRTSAGQVTEPYPTGGVLGAANNSYSFFVVPTTSANDLSVTPSATTFGSNGLSFTVTPPGGTSVTETRVVANMTGIVLADSALTPSGGGYLYTYNPTTLNQTFKNLDTDGADTVNLTFYLKGTNNGQTVHLVRRILLVGGRVYTTQ